MALIKCPECGREISDKAATCPNCGCPIKKEKTKKIVSQLRSIKLNKKAVIIIVSVAVVLIVGLVILNSFSKSSKLIPFGLNLGMSFDQINKSMESFGFQYYDGYTGNTTFAHYSGKDAFGVEPNDVEIRLNGNGLSISIYYPSDKEKSLLKNLVSQFGDAAIQFDDAHDTNWVWKENNTGLLLKCGFNSSQINCYEVKSSAEIDEWLNYLKTTEVKDAVYEEPADYAEDAVYEEPAEYAEKIGR